MTIPDRSRLRSLISLHSLSLVIISLVVGALAITNQSMWMDEGNAIVKAMMPSIQEMWSFSKYMQGSEIQMPFFMLSLWCWEKVAGDSEYALRLINLPFLIIMVLALCRYRFWPLVCLTSPFVLYYVGELRPYMFQMAGAAVGFSALCRIGSIDAATNDTRGVHGLLFSVNFLAATSLTSAVCSFALILGALIAKPSLLRNIAFWKKAAIWAIPGLLVAGYYGYTLLAGFRGAVDRGGGLLSMAFGGYEMVGLMGLGPGRSEIREMDVIGLISGYPWLPVVAVATTLLWLVGVRIFLTGFRTEGRLALACSVILPVLVFAGVSVIADFSILGRHMSPLIPVLLIPLACACEAAAGSVRTHPVPNVCCSVDDTLRYCLLAVSSVL